MEKTITIIVTTHNRPDLLKRTLLSIVTQNRKDIHVLIISDQLDSPVPLDIISLFEGNCDYIIRGGTQGPAQSRNYGLELVKTPFVMFLDDDDTLMEKYLDALVPVISNSPSLIHFTDFYFCYEDRATTSRNKDLELFFVSLKNVKKTDLFTVNSIPNSCLIYRSELIKTKKFDCEVQIYEDWIFLLDIIQNVEISHIPCGAVLIHKTRSSEGSNARRGNSRDDLIVPMTLKIYKLFPVDYPSRIARQAFFAARGIQLDLSHF